MAMQGVRMRRQADGGERLVEAVLNAARKPLGAYEIRDRIVARGARISVPQVYRVLARLIMQARIRRVETLNAYLIGVSAGDALAICRTCQTAMPLAVGDFGHQIAAQAQAQGFCIDGLVIEARGQCARCSKP